MKVAQQRPGRAEARKKNLPKKMTRIKSGQERSLRLHQSILQGKENRKINKFNKSSRILVRDVGPD